MEFKNRLNPKLETTEGKTHYHSRSVAVCAMIESADNAVLITQRGAKMDTHPGKWCLPCGYLDWDESIHQALAREVWEEVGIDITGAFVEMYHVNDGPNADGLQNITFHFYVKLAQKAADIVTTLCEDEVQAVYWLTRKEIWNNQFDGKDAAFGHFDRIKRLTTISPTSQGPMHVAILDLSKPTQFEY